MPFLPSLHPFLFFVFAVFERILLFLFLFFHLCVTAWDSMAKIGVLHDGLKTIDASQAFDEVIRAPIQQKVRKLSHLQLRLAMVLPLLPGDLTMYLYRHCVFDCCW